MTQGSEKRRRTAHITIRLTPDERAAIDESAQRAGLTAGSHARSILLGAPTPRQVRRPPVERRELAQLLGEVGRVGNNLNQIARALNSGAEPDDGALSEALAGLQPVRDAILAALGRAG
jgi:hypothetical protein